MGERFIFHICLKTGEKRQAGYFYLIQALAMVDEYFMGQSLWEASAENALYLADVLQTKFWDVIERVIVYQDGAEV